MIRTLVWVVKGGLLFDEEEYRKLKEDWQEFIAENQIEETRFTQTM